MQDMQQLYEQGYAWLVTNGADFLLNLVGAVVIFYIGKWAARGLKGVSRRLMQRARLDDTLVSFAANIIYALILAFVIIAALGQLGIQTASLIAILGAAGLAVGLALQGSLSNFAAGVLMILFRPFRVGDYVEAAGTSGTVDEIEIFQTRLRTPDNKVVIVPNASVTGGTIVNYSAMDTRRVDMVIGVHYDTDLSRARNLLMEIITADERVLADPAPVVVVGDLGASTVDFWVRPWCKATDYWPLKWDMLETIKTRLEAEGITIAFPQLDVHLFREEGQGAG
ncbi:mechanosensitive ion channel family protein [Arhodomonas sp. KWT]|uniref:mechanosensitive ion channel family protein n=1 Tax=Arhodomonas sp. KWT TaxID=2679915 RepID=UPI0013D12893|nr:mechanosensitive ion channel domain-containing protein [Arhodomonas sp. KWT]